MCVTQLPIIAVCQFSASKEAQNHFIKWADLRSWWKSAWGKTQNMQKCHFIKRAEFFTGYQSYSEAPFPAKTAKSHFSCPKPLCNSRLKFSYSPLKALAGAGGGGFLVVIARPGETYGSIEASLRRQGFNQRCHRVGVEEEEGLKMESLKNM